MNHNLNNQRKLFYTQGNLIKAIRELQKARMSLLEVEGDADQLVGTEERYETVRKSTLDSLYVVSNDLVKDLGDISYLIELLDTSEAPEAPF
jgi:hypothetical protein